MLRDRCRVCAFSCCFLASDGSRMDHHKATHCHCFEGCLGRKPYGHDHLASLSLMNSYGSPCCCAMLIQRHHHMQGVTNVVNFRLAAISESKAYSLYREVAREQGVEPKFSTSSSTNSVQWLCYSPSSGTGDSGLCDLLHSPLNNVLPPISGDPGRDPL